MLAATCCADDVVLAAASVAAAEVMVAEVIAKLKEVGLTVGAEKTLWTSHPKIMDKHWVCYGKGVGICGIEGCVWMGMQDVRLHTDLLMRTNVWRSGNPF